MTHSRKRRQAELVRSLTASPEPSSSAAASERAQAMRRAYAGAPLLHQVRARVARQRLPGRGWPWLLAVLLALLPAAGLMWSGRDWIWALLAALLVFFVALLGFGALHARRNLRSMADEIDLADHFDRCIEPRLLDLDAAHVAGFLPIRQRLAELLPQLALAREEGRLALDDAFFVRQAVLRYLPDALDRYAAIGSEFRHQVLAGQECSASQLLIQQFQIIDDKLGAIASRLAQFDTSRLAVHGRFLRGKVES